MRKDTKNIIWHLVALLSLKHFEKRIVWKIVEWIEQTGLFSTYLLLVEKRREELLRNIGTECETQVNIACELS